MVGNDIVDLGRALKESNWKRKGYLEKIFTMAERFLISTATDPEVMVWLLWTMKESAYKVNSRETKIRTFAPTGITCNHLVLHRETATGTVLYQGRSYFTWSSITDKYIHTLAAHNEELLDAAIPKIREYEPSDSSYRETHPVSVSHHGNYLALVYL